jgi:hypothetical protein
MSGVGRLIVSLAGFLVIAATTAAQEPLSLQIHDGQVTVKAQNVPLRTILSEWARVGGTNVIGAERIAGAPVTLELTDVPERQALEILLRSVSGYMLAMRPAGSRGASVFNRILIMPPSTAPRALPQQTAGVPVRVAPAPVMVPSPEADNDGPPDSGLEGPVRPATPVRLPTVNGPNLPTPAPLPVPEAAPPVTQTTPGSVVVTPGNPFGLPAGSSSRPGTVTPVPEGQPGQQPANPN